MNPEEYAAAQAAISAATANYVLTLAKFFVRPLLAITDWLNLLQLLFPEIQRQREESAALARRFYDFQREFNHPQLPRNDRPLEGTEFRTFVKNMDPVRKDMSREDSPEHAVASLALRSVREVENAGRQQIIHAVKNEPETRIIRGWARVATGRETCAWCLMLISRGPVYFGADTAGLDLDDTSAGKLFKDAGGDLDKFFADTAEFVEEWHDGCDCKVIPVFKGQQDWPGAQAADRALEIWGDATKAANQLRKLEPDRVHKAGKNKGKPFTINQDTINVLRQMLADGDITSTEWAAVAAA